MIENEDEIKMVTLHILINNLSNDIEIAPIIEKAITKASSMVKN